MNYKDKWITIVYMKNFFKHLRVVIKHKNLVLIHSYKLGILHLGLVHDLSKFSRKEFLPSVKYFSGNYSPIVNERRNEGLYSSIFTHHTNHNKHHYEYWISEFKGDKELIKKYSDVLYDEAMLLEGFEIEDKATFIKNLNELMLKSVCDTPKIIVENVIYPGVELKMLNISRKIKSEMSRVEFTYNELSREIINKPIQNKEV